MVSYSSSRKHAVVLGGSMAGLFAARVLTEYFERVFLIERDYYPADPVFRPGVPQGRQLHFLLQRGQQVIEELFPGTQQAAVARGATELDYMQDWLICTPGGWLARIPSRQHGYMCSRHLLEWQIRQALVKSPQVQIIDGHEAINVLASEDAKSIKGVSLRARPRPGEQAQGTTPTAEVIQMVADLVVDATGRESKAPQWLEALGYAAPPETTINPFYGTATRFYAPPADPGRDWVGLQIQSDPPRNPRGGAIGPTEDGNWIVGLGGSMKEYPPTDEDGFLKFAQRLPDPAIFEAIKDAKPLSPVYGYRRNENRWRHFEQLDRHPEGFISIGDAVCTFNPVYGQGMTVAGLGAITLRESLSACDHDDLFGLARDFQSKLARVTALPWSLATAKDVLVTAVEGGKMKWATKLRFAYLDRLVRILPSDPSIADQFYKVIHMIEPPTSLFHPSIARKVIFAPKSKLGVR